MSYQVKNVHQGRNIKRFREMLGIKQDALAVALGEEWNQKKVSILEQKETITLETVSQVALILKVPTEAIQNLDDESALEIITNTFATREHISHSTYQPPQFNPLDKIVELYERMLHQQQEMIDRLEKLVDRK
ncbi:helix-turn-helix domain-containing protein [Sphingobacterium corticibacter]|uniref:Transcriptional regulator n=1 Tax=Sphingobacterium corticibacter TaxID=2171749 RepID=A0A2T8HIS3_9SPHI|nr:helix-turn-helix transcriptional regulator [Sphingobacterium corticibacter]PVH25202.1 transcriptional regulator [Sphingobacterium corticibacter]